MSGTTSACSHMPNWQGVCSKIVCSVSSHLESMCSSLVLPLLSLWNWVETPHVGIVEKLAMIKYSLMHSNQTWIQNEACEESEVFLSVLMFCIAWLHCSPSCTHTDGHFYVDTSVMPCSATKSDLKCSSSSSRPLCVSLLLYSLYVFCSYKNLMV